MAMLRVHRRALSQAAGGLHLLFGGTCLPHPEKADKGGEDSYFADEETGSFGVADGVGGSASKKVDPGLFSRALLRACHGALATGGRAEDGSLRRALAAAGDEFARQPLGGSSTVLLGQLAPGDETLRLLNLGDSGAMLFRPSRRRFRQGVFMWPRIVLQTHDQTHYFNCPYQVSAADVCESAAEADELRTAARPGDILIGATDGVLDNLFVERDIQLHVAHAVADLLSADASHAQRAADTLARQIASQAAEIGHRQDEEGLPTPFAASAAREGYKFEGGKLDDVAVVCGVVRGGERPPPRPLLSNFAGGASGAEAGRTAAEHGDAPDVDARAMRGALHGRSDSDFPRY